ncbi:MAG: hypothetical protein A2X35_03210 [Elusimicrobia bacterium GWA2_61_42]|nr:MAG: hypothetical protein A2X35_03210 [Elusimicrobia bacterium GWA2_61_42]OGR77594.1 MAG: hypothetical protein A2X38_09450 [Elusimicrobia bacterium GWC2_61_25]
MAQAIILSPSLAAESGAQKLIKNSLVYLGDEFCIHKQPAFSGFEAVTRLTGRRPALLSTLLTDPAFERWEALLAACAKKAPGTEVVINDIGLLRFIDKKYRGKFSLTLGRLMTYFFDTKHTRLPGCSRPIMWTGEALPDPGPGAAAEKVREAKKMKDWESKLDVTPMAYLKDFIKRYKVSRVETDSREIFKKYADNTAVKLSFHYPLRLMSMTRICPFMGGIVPACSAPCGSRLLSLKTKELDFAVFSKGNAYFAKNRLISHPRLDRAVELPYVNSPGFKQVMNKYSCPDHP